MKYYPLLGLSLLFISHLALAQQPVASAQSQKVLASQAARFTAMIDRDMKTLDDLVADNLSYGHTTGRIESKSQFLAGIEAMKVQYLSLQPKDLVVTVNKKTAIIRGLVDAKLKVGEKNVETTIRFLEVYHLKKGTWQLAAWQAVRYVSG